MACNRTGDLGNILEICKNICLILPHQLTSTPLPQSDNTLADEGNYQFSGVDLLLDWHCYDVFGYI